jgi:hypothetical protein
MTKVEIRQAIELAMQTYDRPVEKIEKVLCENLLTKYSANYRAGSSQMRMGKNGNGKHAMSEARQKWTAFS